MYVGRQVEVCRYSICRVEEGCPLSKKVFRSNTQLEYVLDVCM